MTVSPAPHGTARRYSHGTRTIRPCRCGPCREANNAARRQRRRLSAYGRLSLVDAGPAREHVTSIHRTFGLGVHRIAQLAGVSYSPVAGLLGRGRGAPTRRVRRDTAAKLLAISPTLDDLDEHTRIDACGSRRRLQALVVSGRPVIVVAAETGLSRTTVTGLMHGHWLTLRVGTARAIRDASARLVPEPPPQRTPAQRRRVAAARGLAARHGWLPFGVWADIDDPAAEPEVDGGARPDPDGDTRIVDAVLAERVSWDQLSPADKSVWVHWGVRNGWKRAEMARRARADDANALSHYMAKAKAATR